jgi:hypothetical protein
MSSSTVRPRKLWVRVKPNVPGAVSYPTQVSTEGCENNDDFAQATKDKLQLPNPPQEISLHLTEDGPALKRSASLPDPNTEETALVVKVHLPPVAPGVDASYNSPSALGKHGRSGTSVSGSCPPKRGRSVSSRASNGTALNQSSFRERILARDTKGCVLTGKDELDCHACHIVPWAYFQKWDLLGQEIWNSLFPYSCFKPMHQVMDVRNGILMWSPLNAQFDIFAFTIIKKGSVYEVESLREDEMETPKNLKTKELQITVANLNGMRFKFDDEKQDMWPGESFLQLHNRIFYKKREANRLRAQAEAQELTEEDSAQTITNEREESILKVKNWFTVMADDRDLAII